MKKLMLILSVFLMCSGTNAFSQDGATGERYGKALNLGIGIGGYSGYYGYLGRSLPVFHVNYEFDVANNFTLAPFVTFYSYSTNYYRETVIPLGIKGSYYFDGLLQANSDWDFYLAGSLGFAIVSSRWNSDYYGDKDVYHHGNPLFLDIHIGTEYHLSERVGLFLDLSSGVSTLGLAIH